MTNYFKRVDDTYLILSGNAHHPSIPLVLSHDILDDIITTAFEGGINYWAVVHNDNPLFEEFKDMPLATKAVNILLNGYDIKITDTEDEYVGYLTLHLLLLGFRRYLQDVMDRNLQFCIDADSADMIIQYALFDQLIFS